MRESARWVREGARECERVRESARARCEAGLRERGAGLGKVDWLLEINGASVEYNSPSFDPCTNFGVVDQVPALALSPPGGVPMVLM